MAKTLSTSLLPREPTAHPGGAVAAPALGLLAGIFVQLNGLADAAEERWTGREALLRLGVSACFGAVLFGLSRHQVLSWLAPRLTGRARGALEAHHGWTYAVFLFFAGGATGLRLPGPLTPLLLVALFIAANASLMARADPALRTRVQASFGYLAFLFFLSGMAALIYQVTWQRLLFASFGVNIESVTLIVTIFMFGLGVGSLLGGFLSRRGVRELPRLFLLCEVGVGAFGMISVPLIKATGGLTVQSPLPVTGAVIFVLLSLPTLLMGATLPILTAYAHEHYQNVGRTVGLLYFVNTLGSAAACFLTADVLFVLGGQQAAVGCAALCNLLVAFLVRGYTRAVAHRPNATEAA